MPLLERRQLDRSQLDVRSSPDRASDYVGPALREEEHEVLVLAVVLEHRRELLLRVPPHAAVGGVGGHHPVVDGDSQNGSVPRSGSARDDPGNGAGAAGAVEAVTVVVIEHIVGGDLNVLVIDEAPVAHVVIPAGEQPLHQ